jgi:hypothetical protein
MPEWTIKFLAGQREDLRSPFVLDEVQLAFRLFPTTGMNVTQRPVISDTCTRPCQRQHIMEYRNYEITQRFIVVSMLSMISCSIRKCVVRQSINQK